MEVPWQIETVKIEISKHFAIKYMRRWSWDFFDLRDAIRDVYKVEKVGKEKYEAYVQKKGYKKIILVYYNYDKVIFCITGSEGGERK